MQYPKTSRPEIQTIPGKKQVDTTKNYFNHTQVPDIGQGEFTGADQCEAIKYKAGWRNEIVKTIIKKVNTKKSSGNYWEKQMQQ